MGDDHKCLTGSVHLVQQGELLTWSQRLLSLKGHIDYVLGAGDFVRKLSPQSVAALVELREAQVRLAAFTSAMDELASLDGPELFARRRVLRRQHLKDLLEVVEKGSLGPQRLGEVLTAVRRAGSGSQEARAIER